METFNLEQHYHDFLRGKIKLANQSGFEVDESEINPMLKPHQKAIVKWAVEGGNRAIFAAFGLGKTFMQIEILRILRDRVKCNTLIVTPLGVRHEFMRDGEKLGVTFKFIRTDDEIELGYHFYLTNYESVRDGKLDVSAFKVVSLDEASVLRSYGSKTYQEFLPLFAQVPYKFVATATPSPNRYKELIHYAGFLNIMDTGQALTRFFQRDSTQANNLTLYPHKEREFWLWLHSWAIFIQAPSDLGFDDTGYDLPPLEVIWHEVPTDHSQAPCEKDGQGVLFKSTAMGLSAAASEKRESLPARIAKMKEIIDADPFEHYILWHDLEAERHAIQAAVPDAQSVYGTLDLEIREQRVIDFSDGKIQYLSTKPEISGSGCNFQRHCHKAIFLGVGYKFNDFIQSIHRIYRFLQTETCQIHIIHSEAEREVRRVLETKWEQHKSMVKNMSAVIREHGLATTSMHDILQRTIGVERLEKAGQGWRVTNNDAVLEAMRQAENSVGLIVTSIPFCYDETTEVLTRRGWLTFDKVAMDDEVATVHPTNLCLEWQRPTGRVWEHYDGEMLHFTGRSFDHMVTPNHRMFAARRSAEGFDPSHLHLVEASIITTAYEQANRTKHNDGRIQRGWRTCLVPPFRGDGKRPKTITIPTLPPEIRNGHGVQIYWIESEDFMRLAGWYLSEGHADSFETGRQGGRISIGQTAANQPFRDEIENMFLRCGLPPSIQLNQITVWCRNLAWFLQQEFGHGASAKRIPTWVKDLHPDLLDILRDTMMMGEGSKDLRSYASISRRLRDDFQEICLATGWRSSVDSEDKAVSLGQSQLFPEIRQTPQMISYSGMIGCLTVPNHTLIVRRNGKAFVSGNSNHYEYTPSYNDFGHTEDNRQFWAQMDYLTPQLLRILQPGRLYCCHVKDRILFGNVTGAGAPTVSPFHAEALMHGIKHGFDYMGMITVVTDVVRENNQTYRLGWSENAKDGTKMGVGSPEYILLFRKPQTDRAKGYADVPVAKPKIDYTRAQWQVDASAFWRSSGNRPISAEELSMLGPDKLARAITQWSLENVYDYDFHVKLGKDLEAKGSLPSTFSSLALGSHDPAVWHDVNRMLTLNGKQTQKGLQNHVCPLQLDIVNRLIDRYSNPGDLVYDPFGGLMTVPYCAIKKGRKGAASELNTGYFFDGVAYLKAAEREIAMPDLFDLLELEAA